MTKVNQTAIARGYYKVLALKIKAGELYSKNLLSENKLLNFYLSVLSTTYLGEQTKSHNICTLTYNFL